MVTLLALMVVTAGPARATDQEVFHGWSKDGTWLAYEVHGSNDLVELYFCATSEAKPSWPASLNDVEREDMNGLSCVHLMDPNKAPWQWKVQLAVPAPSSKAAGVEVTHELSFDGESPGFILEAGDKKQVCHVPGLREDSKVQKSWFHSSGRFVAAMVNGTFHHCVVTVKAGAPAAKPPRKH